MIKLSPSHLFVWFVIRVCTYTDVYTHVVDCN